MDSLVIKLTNNFSIAPEIKDPSGFALYDAHGGAHAWMNEDEASFSDGDEYRLSLDKQKQSITLVNVSRNTSKTISY